MALPATTAPRRGEGAGAPVELGGVARDKPHVGDIDAELVGDDLRKGGEVALALRADARGDAHAAAGFDRHLGPLIGADAGAFDIGDDADADVAACRAQARLFLLEELVITDQLHGLVERREVVAAVIGKRRKVLVDDLVAVGELVGRDQVALADLDAVDAELAGGEVEQAFHHEDAVLAAGAAVGRNDRLVGKDRLELAVVVGHVILAEQRALAVERHSQAVGGVGAGIMHEDVVHAQDFAVARQGNLGLMHLAALLRGGEEVLLAVLDPLDGAAEAHGDPGNEDLFRIEHHDFGAEAAADKGRNHAHLLFGEAEHRGKPVADGDRRLGGVPDGQLLVAWVPAGHDAAVFHGGGGPAVVGKAALNQDVGLLPCHRIVTLALDGVGVEILRQVIVDKRRSGVEGVLDIDHGGQHLDLDQDLFGRVLCRVAGCGHDDGKRLARMADLVLGQGDLGARD